MCDRANFNRFISKNKSPIKDWPFVGMLPGVLLNASRIHDYFSHLLRQSNHTIKIKGPWFSNLNFILTSDPENIHYILSTSFANFNKGRNFKEVFEVLGDGILVADSDSWKMQRKLTHILFRQSNFLSLLETTAQQNVQNGLFKILDHASESGLQVDMQDLCQRFTFDENYLSTLNLFLNRHPTPQAKPSPLGISAGRPSGRVFSGQRIQAWRPESPAEPAKLVREQCPPPAQQARLDPESQTSPPPPLDLAPAVAEAALAGEPFPSFAELNKLVYLHATLCETLRLYPPVPINRKASIKPDTLPSGHQVNQETEILLSIYTMGRMHEIWGADASAFNPDRWISDKGKIIDVPSYKFNTFRAGPRTCVGKDLAFMELKIAAAAIIWSYDLHVVTGGQSASSLALHMEHGLKVNVTTKTIL
uniref:Cytochrome P450 n=1 Tax=Kalanchoe fedtschenkoi TaxID=63787 RepID=A0A7N0RFU3_KALFE